MLMEGALRPSIRPSPVARSSQANRATDDGWMIGQKAHPLSARRSPERCRRLAAVAGLTPREEVPEEGEDQGRQDHGRQREVEAAILSLDRDIPRQSAYRQANAEYRQPSDHHQHNADEQDEAAEVRRHRVLLVRSPRE